MKSKRKNPIMVIRMKMKPTNMQLSKPMSRMKPMDMMKTRNMTDNMILDNDNPLVMRKKTWICRKRK